MEKNRFTIFLDAGHGGLGKKFDIPHRYTTYPSKCFQHTSHQLFHGYGWFFEGVFNRDIVDLLDVMLKTEGFNTLKLYHEIDDTPLKLRSSKANSFKDYDAAILVSVHGNAGPKGANGWEVFTSPGQTQADTLATLIYDEVKNTNLFRMRPDITDGDVDKEAKFHMVCNVKVPAVLTENGFFTDRNDAMKMFNKESQHKIANAHFNAIKKYFSILSF
jgi:N-acetylmuramoyl-L-alanine amidase